MCAGGEGRHWIYIPRLESPASIMSKVPWFSIKLSRAELGPAALIMLSVDGKCLKQGPWHQFDRALGVPFVIIAHF